MYNIQLGQVKIHGETCIYTNNTIKLRFPEKKELLKCRSEHSFSVQFVTYVCGKIELTLLIQLTDMVTKRQKELEHFVVIESESATIGVSDKILNFDVIPEEGNKTLILDVKNCSKVQLPITVTIIQDNNTFSFGNPSDPDVMCDDFTTKLTLNIAPKEIVNIPIDMLVPTLEDLGCSTDAVEIEGKLVFYLQNETYHVLKQVPLVGCIGKTKVQFRTSCLPMIISPEQTKTLYLKNSGIVDLYLEGYVINDETKEEDTIFTIEPTTLLLKASQEAQIKITFNPSGRIAQKIYRLLKLKHKSGPTFTCNLEGIPREISIKSPSLRKTLSPNNLRNISPSTLKISPSRSGKYSPSLMKSTSSLSNAAKSISPSSERSSSDHGSVHLINGKLPIETTKQELVWGCVKVGKSQNQKFVIRNRLLQRVRFQVTVANSAFKIVKEENEYVTTLPLLMHGMESRTIIINFTPNAKGAFFAKLCFSSIESYESENLKLQSVFLFGYGGHSHVNIEGVFKDSSGHMWLSFGKMSHQLEFEKSFTLRNTGSLTAFTNINLNCNGMFSIIKLKFKYYENFYCRFI